MTKPTRPLTGRYSPEFTSPVNLREGTAVEPLPKVNDVTLLEDPEAAL